MNCPAYETLSAYADREGEAAEALSLEAHLPGCARCRRRLAGLLASKAALARLPVPPMPDDLRRALLDMVPDKAWKPWWLGSGWLRPAAGLALAAACVWAMIFRTREARSPSLEVPLELFLAAHNQYALTLPLAQAEKLAAELPLQLAGGAEDRDAY